MEERQKRPERQGKLFGEINALRHADDSSEAEHDDKKQFSEHSFFGRMARHKHFEYATLAVIVFNAFYLGYDCDYSARWGKPEELYKSSLWGFMLMDNFFCLFFTVELVVRFFGYKSKLYSCTDIAFIFDLVLVVMMIIETWVLAFIGQIDALKQVSILRLLRLTRLLRMGKLLRYLPELQLIVKGMLAAVRSVGCAGILCGVVLYVFAIIFTDSYHQGHKKDDDPDIEGIEELFGSMGKSMRHLLIMGTILDDITACTNTIRSTNNIFMLLVFLLCVIISSFTLFNMLVGILCEVVQATSDRERTKAEETKITELMEGFFKKMDLDSNGQICAQEFMKMRNHVEVMSALEKLDINHDCFNKYAELLFTPQNDGDKMPSLEYHECVSLIMRLRPGMFLNRCDFHHFKFHIQKKHREIFDHLEDLEQLLDDCNAANEDFEQMACDHKDATIRKVTGRSGPGQSLAILAESPVAELSLPPPISSKWQEAVEFGFGSPRNPPRNTEEVVTERLQQLVEQREVLSKEAWKAMPNTPCTQLKTFSGTFVPMMDDLRATAESLSDEEDSNNSDHGAPLLD